VAFANRDDAHHDWAVGPAAQIAEPRLQHHLPQLHARARRYAGRRPDLADLRLIQMTELHPFNSVITVDSDFRIYWRNKRKTIPVVAPPATGQGR
jgi:hypothetical protein